ncbi:unnamed protein product [Rotaria sp. Silwood2]|nr:unnamed protein product [Rotaria sp. Silwood2]
MPLFGRRLFHLNNNNNDENLKQDNEEIYTIEHTGEKFNQRDLYEKLKKAYDLERWTCESTWRAGLTHKEAYQSEIDIRKSLSSMVPSYFHKPIFDIIYHNVKPLEKLAEEVSIILGQSFVIEVQENVLTRASLRYDVMIMQEVQAIFALMVKSKTCPILIPSTTQRALSNGMLRFTTAQCMIFGTVDGAVQNSKIIISGYGKSEHTVG